MDITVSCDEALTGTFSLNTSSGALSGTSTYSSASVGSVHSGTTIYIAIAPGTKNYFTVNWLGESDYKTKDKMSVTFEAGKIYNLGNTSEW